MWFRRKKTQPLPEFVERRRVTMRNDNGHTAIDYVPLNILDAYVADAKTRWPVVVVGEHHDAGPGGNYGPIAHMPHLEGK